MSFDRVMEILYMVEPPSDFEKDTSMMTMPQRETAILDVCGALRHFDGLLALLDRATFESDDDRVQAKIIAALVQERIDWALDYFCNLRPPC